MICARVRQGGGTRIRDLPRMRVAALARGVLRRAQDAENALARALVRRFVRRVLARDSFDVLRGESLRRARVRDPAAGRSRPKRRSRGGGRWRKARDDASRSSSLHGRAHQPGSRLDGARARHARRRSAYPGRAGACGGYGGERLPGSLGARRFRSRRAPHGGRRGRHGARERLLLHRRATPHLDPAATIDPAQVERTESMFFHELPPNDGTGRISSRPGIRRSGSESRSRARRRPRLRSPASPRSSPTRTAPTARPPKWRTSATGFTSRAGCSPPRSRSGSGSPGWTRSSADRGGRERTTCSYPVPQPYQMYWTSGYVTPIPVVVKGEDLSIDVPLGDKQKPGLLRALDLGKSSRRAPTSRSLALQ